MFATTAFGHLTKFYRSSCTTKLTFHLPLNSKSSLRKFATRRTHLVNYCRKYPIRLKKALRHQRLNYATNITKQLKDAKKENVKPQPIAMPNIGKNIMSPKLQIKSTIGNRQSITVFEGLYEFLAHPLTWDRNNGYFNILLGLAIFGYTFCTSCNTDANPSYEDKRK